VIVFHGKEKIIRHSMQEEKKKTIHKQQIIKEKRTGNNKKE